MLYSCFAGADMLRFIHQMRYGLDVCFKNDCSRVFFSLQAKILDLSISVREVELQQGTRTELAGVELQQGTRTEFT
jgi:hypothetical protein